MPTTSSSSARASGLDDFLALSRVLTGVDSLNAELGGRYLDRLNSSPFSPSLRQILMNFHEWKGQPDITDRVKQQIVADNSLRPTVCQIILLWYTSAAQDNLGLEPPAVPVMRFSTPEEYFSGLVWSLIGAHPPGLSGGYFGHWRYRPENAPLEKP